MKEQTLRIAKEKTLENLEEMQGMLERCIEEGMIDLEDSYHNELLGLIEEAHLVKGWDELREVITKARTLEVDIAAWLARLGRTTLSFSWPRPPPIF
ncbi:MAG: hypothetical protein KGI80_00110 [Verrucomicrobiota bacterium]|nr:hypothetical protein [Verrucomicrobiota bacterium]